jgi:hypothetical protein
MDQSKVSCENGEVEDRDHCQNFIFAVVKLSDQLPECEVSHSFN